MLWNKGELVRMWKLPQNLGSENQPKILSVTQQNQEMPSDKSKCQLILDSSDPKDVVYDNMIALNGVWMNSRTCFCHLSNYISFFCVT